jgi:hypothetical protein
MPKKRANRAGSTSEAGNVPVIPLLPCPICKKHESVSATGHITIICAFSMLVDESRRDIESESSDHTITCSTCRIEVRDKAGESVLRKWNSLTSSL